MRRPTRGMNCSSGSFTAGLSSQNVRWDTAGVGRRAGHEVSSPAANPPFDTRPVGFPELFAVERADGRAGQRFGDELDLRRLLVRTEPVAAELVDLLLGDRRLAVD